MLTQFIGCCSGVLWMWEERQEWLRDTRRREARELAEEHQYNVDMRHGETIIDMWPIACCVCECAGCDCVYGCDDCCDQCGHCVGREGMRL